MPMQGMTIYDTGAAAEFEAKTTIRTMGIEALTNSMMRVGPRFAWQFASEDRQTPSLPSSLKKCYTVYRHPTLLHQEKPGQVQVHSSQWN